MYIHTSESCPTQDFVQMNRTLSSSTGNLRPGDSVTFLCTTVCSYIQAWDSADYIDTGGNYLEVLCLPNMTSRVTKGLAAATRIDCYQINETCTVIISRLNFIVQAGIPTAQISCINVNKNCNDTIEFSVSRKFSMEQTLVQRQCCQKLGFCPIKVPN